MRYERQFQFSEPRTGLLFPKGERVKVWYNLQANITVRDDVARIEARIKPASIAQYLGNQHVNTRDAHFRDTKLYFSALYGGGGVLTAPHQYRECCQPLVLSEWGWSIPRLPGQMILPGVTVLTGGNRESHLQTLAELEAVPSEENEAWRALVEFYYQVGTRAYLKERSAVEREEEVLR